MVHLGLIKFQPFNSELVLFQQLPSWIKSSDVDVSLVTGTDVLRRWSDQLWDSLFSWDLSCIAKTRFPRFWAMLFFSLTDFSFPCYSPWKLLMAANRCFEFWKTHIGFWSTFFRETRQFYVVVFFDDIETAKTTIIWKFGVAFTFLSFCVAKLQSFNSEFILFQKLSTWILLSDRDVSLVTGTDLIQRWCNRLWDSLFW